MSKRNFILIVIILVVIVAVVFGFLYFYQPKNTTGGTTTGTNFFANFYHSVKAKLQHPQIRQLQLMCQDMYQQQKEKHKI